MNNIKILEKQVSERTSEEHLYLIKYMFGGNVRNYLLSMGVFKEEPKKTLSDKIFHKGGTSGWENCLYKFDVKDFIKTIKKKMISLSTNAITHAYMSKILRIIDEEAGEQLR